MDITTKPYAITKLTFFTRVLPTNSGKLNVFEVWPKEQHRLNIVETIATTSMGTAHSVGFVLDGVPYYLPSESKFIPN